MDAVEQLPHDALLHRFRNRYSASTRVFQLAMIANEPLGIEQKGRWKNEVRAIGTLIRCWNVGQPAKG